MKVYKLANTVQHYPWGAAEAIPGLLGIENRDNRPFAELWMGAHPKAPSDVLTDAGPVAMDKLVHENPREVLGASICDRFGDRLPFLFKILAAGSPLSIQAHPDLEQAREGFAREEREGVPLDAPHRNYKDCNHKPEILCAMTPFWAMCGFRPREELCAELDAFGAQRLLASALSGLKAETGRAGVREMFRRLMTASDEEKRSAVAWAVDACRGMTGDRHQWVVKLGDQYPGDIGVLCPLILNLTRLEPGEAIYLEAGVLHAYLGGTGIELMASSDNVLRGGLTGKHVDVPELLSVLTFEAAELSIIRAEASIAGIGTYATPSEEFELSILRPTDRIRYGGRAVEIMICTEGTCVVQAGDSRCTVGQGDSVLVPAGAGERRISGNATLFRAGVPGFP